MGVNFEQHRRPDMSPENLISHILNNFYFLLREEKPNLFLIKHSLEELCINLNLPKKTSPEEIISKALEIVPPIVKNNDFYVKELIRMAKEASKLLKQ